METFVALLRAVNVGGFGKLPMSELRALCEEAGLGAVRTYIQSGNVVFRSALPERRVQALLEKALAARMGKPVGVHVRTGAALAEILAKNPFPEAEPSKVVVIFLDEPPPRGAAKAVKPPGREALVLSGRELYVHYPDGIGRSKLKIPFAAAGTARNLNTVAKLAALAELEPGTGFSGRRGRSSGARTPRR